MWLTILYLGYEYAHNAFTQKVKMTSLDSKTVQVDLVVFARQLFKSVLTWIYLIVEQ